MNWKLSSTIYLRLDKKKKKTDLQLNLESIWKWVQAQGVTRLTLSAGLLHDQYSFSGFTLASFWKLHI